MLSLCVWKCERTHLPASTLKHIYQRQICAYALSTSPPMQPFELPSLPSSCLPSQHAHLNSEQKKYKYFEHITVLLIDKITNKRFYY